MVCINVKGDTMARNKNPEQTIELIISESMKLFLSKGYDKTSMQDIINATNLSKGGIYHHFVSKEAIFEAMCFKLGDGIITELTKTASDKGLNGAQKLTQLFIDSVNNQKQDVINKIMPTVSDNPRILLMQMNIIQNVTAPKLLSPILEEGIADGSIKAENPLELAEIILLLVNIWINPAIFKVNNSNVLLKINMVNKMLSVYGFELFNDEMIKILIDDINENNYS